MEKIKVGLVVLASLALVGLVFAGIVSARPPLGAGDFRKNVIYKRVIADNVDEYDIKLLESKGCLIRHRLGHSTSFECPEDIVPKLNVRESRIFYIMDLDADKQIGADKVWAEGITGSGIKVAVLDTGIDTDHPELQDSYLGGYDYVYNDPFPEDDHGHGTHVSGIITANGAPEVNSKGVAPGAGIYMYKVCNAAGACYEDDMAAAMEAAVETDAKAMSISIGGGSYTGENCDSDSLAAKVNWVVSEGLTVVVAAGNDGKGVSSPGCASGAIAVGAVDKNNNVPYWSGRGKALDIVAPGVNIYSSVIDGYGYMSGTSMATPHIAGVVILLLETNSSLATPEIKTALYDTASPVNKCYKCTRWWGSYCFRQQEVTCTPEITGAGVVNAYEAYLTVKPTGPECLSDIDCDDGVSCTDDSCINQVCVYTPNDTYCLADGWHETGNTRWVQDTQCAEKEQKEQEYRDYYCDATLDCQYNVTDTQWVDTGAKTNKTDGTACDDGLYCNVGEACQSGLCTGGEARDCSTLSNQCNNGVCDEAVQTCVAQPKEDGTVCDDSNSCTTADVCFEGTCSGTSITECISGDGCCPAGCTFETDVDLDCPQVQAMHVANIEMGITERWRGWYKAGTAIITIEDATFNPVEGATVYGQWSGATSDSDSGVTDEFGQVIFQSDGKWARNSLTFTLCVENIEKTDWVYDESANAITCNSITASSSRSW